MKDTDMMKTVRRNAHIEGPLAQRVDPTEAPNPYAQIVSLPPRHPSTSIGE